MLFKPYLVGIDELGVGEALSNVLLSFNEEERAILVKNVFLTGKICTKLSRMFYH